MWIWGVNPAVRPPLETHLHVKTSAENKQDEIKNVFSVWFLLFFGHLAKYCRNIQSSIIRANGYKETKTNHNKK